MPFLTQNERDEIKAHLTKEGLQAFKEILKSYKVDLNTNIHGYFSQEDLPLIWGMAGGKLKSQLLSASQASGYSFVSGSWQKIVEDFYLNKYWEFKLHHGDEPKMDWEDKYLEDFEVEAKKSKAIIKEARPYILRFFIGLVIWKMVILYLAQNGFFDWWGDN